MEHDFSNVHVLHFLPESPLTMISYFLLSLQAKEPYYFLNGDSNEHLPKILVLNETVQFSKKKVIEKVTFEWVKTY